MTDHPQWVWERAAQELNDVHGINRWSAGYDKECEAMCAVANLIAKYEQPPVDPDEAVVKAVLDAWTGFADSFEGWPTNAARALAVYKAHKALDTTPTA